MEDYEYVADMNDVSSECLKTKDDDMTEGENDSCGEEFKSASEMRMMMRKKVATKLKTRMTLRKVRRRKALRGTSRILKMRKT